MNQILEDWNKSVLQPKYQGLDSVDIDGESILIEGKIVAVRKNIETNPILDNSAGNERNKILSQLPKNHLDTILRYAKTTNLDRVQELRTITYMTLKRLELRKSRDLSKAVKGIPKGSDQVNVGSIKDWMNKIQPKHKKAILQLIKIDATCCMRSK